MTTIDELTDKIAGWHYERNLVEGTTHAKQFLKLSEEVGELAKSLAHQTDIKDDVGDIVVVLINLCLRERITLRECLETAWDDIKHRKGKMVDGVYIKEENQLNLPLED